MVGEKNMEFLKELFMPSKDKNLKIGLCQFKNTTTESFKEEISIKNKDVKLSDLMRRHNC